MWFSRSSAAIWRGAGHVANFLPGLLKRTRVKNPILAIVLAFTVLIFSFLVAIPTYLLIAPILQIILTILATIVVASRVLWNSAMNLINPESRVRLESPESGDEAGTRAAILDMTTTGVRVMENRGFTYSVWSRAMLDDTYIKTRLGAFSPEDEQTVLQRVYRWSRAMLIGIYQYKAGTRDYDEWRDDLFNKVDQNTMRDIERYTQEFYRLVDEKERQNAPSRDAEWILTALVGTTLKPKAE